MSDKYKFKKILDQSGGYDIDKETQEAEMKRKLFMANKRFESLEPIKLKLATEFYTEVFFKYLI